MDIILKNFKTFIYFILGDNVMAVLISIFVSFLMILITVYFFWRISKRVRSPVKERIRDVGIVGIVIYSCGVFFKSYELTVAGSLIWAYGVLLLLAEEYRKGKEESRRIKR